MNTVRPRPTGPAHLSKPASEMLAGWFIVKEKADTGVSVGGEIAIVSSLSYIMFLIATKGIQI